MDGQRVNRSGQFLGKNFIHQAMTVNSAFAFEAI